MQPETYSQNSNCVKPLCFDAHSARFLILHSDKEHVPIQQQYLDSGWTNRIIKPSNPQKKKSHQMCIHPILLCNLSLYCQTLNVQNTNGPLEQVTRPVKMNPNPAADLQLICAYYVFLTVKHQ